MLQCRDGGYGHPSRECPKGIVSLSVREVRSCFEGRALARADAIAQLTGQQFLILFPENCEYCGCNHKIAAENLRRAARALTNAEVRSLLAHAGTNEVLRVAAIRRSTPEDTVRAQQALARERVPPPDTQRRRRRRLGLGDGAAPSVAGDRIRGGENAPGG